MGAAGRSRLWLGCRCCCGRGVTGALIPAVCDDCSSRERLATAGGRASLVASLFACEQWDLKGAACSESHSWSWGETLLPSFCPPGGVRFGGLLGSSVPVGEGDVLGLKLPSCFGTGSSYLNVP